MSDLLGKMKTRLVEFLDSTNRNLDVKDLLVILSILNENGVKVIKHEGLTSSGQEKLRKLFTQGFVSDIFHAFFSAWMKTPMARIMLQTKIEFFFIFLIIFHHIPYHLLYS
ncbi:hypothetical protein L5515_018789 [Caenorhabditis briggsae]|uniref:Uncharacterized protein n=1 Tax=Caenorhabditis briggsae TaxID=6238 RepID=A0AAE9JUP4_CAEBR|nr:hypothetical protein L5515_018789 [Caenorhabditis briggsae]